MRWWTIAALSAALTLGAGCDDDGRQRTDGTELPGADQGPQADAGAKVDLGPGPVDRGVDPPRVDRGADPDAGVDMAAPDADPPDMPQPDMAPLPDMGPVIPEECNGADEDGDGRVDEGVANLCGGCEPAPVDGCQSWRINLIQSGNGTLFPDRVVGLQGQVVGVAAEMIEGGQCELINLASRLDPDAHIGVVNVDASIQDLNIVPVFDGQTGGFIYDNNPDLISVAVYNGGEEVGVRTGGGAIVGPIDETLTAPRVIEGLDVGALESVAAAARGEPVDGEVIRLEWDPAEAREQDQVNLRLFIGGSVPVFGPSRLYRAIEFYQLDGLLVDDGLLELPVELFGGGVPSSAIWVYAIRELARRVIQGPHAVDIVAGQRVEARVPGLIDPPEGGESPFDIVEPDPNAPEFVAGEPLTVRWTPLPPGEGPLELTLAYRDLLAEKVVQVVCVPDDPHQGALTLPGAFTEGLPDDGFAQISLRWGIDRVELAPPDRGVFARAVSVVLRLDR